MNADLNATGFGGWSALQHAVSCSRENMVALLLEHDANPNVVDETGTSALHIAAARGAINIVVRLIEAHADVNAQNTMGARPLHHGAFDSVEGPDLTILICVPHRRPLWTDNVHEKARGVRS